MRKEQNREEDQRLCKEIGQRLATARRNAGYTQKEVAEKLDMTSSAYAHFEHGREVKGSMLIRLCTLFQCSPNWVLGMTDEGQFLEPEDPIMVRLERACEILNKKGKEKVVGYAEDLTGNPSMTKSGGAEVPDIEVLEPAQAAEVA